MNLSARQKFIAVVMWLTTLTASILPAAASREPYAYDGTMHVGDIYQVAWFAPNEFVTLGEDQKITRWSSLDGRKLDAYALKAQLTGRHAYRLRVGDGRIWLLSRSLQGAAQASFQSYDPKTRALGKAIDIAGPVPVDFVLDENRGRIIYVGGNADRLRIINIADSAESWAALPGRPTSLCSSQTDPAVVYIGHGNGVLAEWNGADGSLRKVDLGQRIFELACNGGGDLYVSHFGSAAISRVDRGSLTPLGEMSVSDERTKIGYLSLCASDDDTIYAAGSLSRGQVIQLYKLSPSSPGPVKQASLGTNSAMSLACDAKRVIVGTADPAVFNFNDGLQRVSVKGPESADFRDIGNYLGFDPRTGTAYFSTRFGGRTPVQFSFETLSLRPQQAPSYRSSSSLSCNDAKSLLGPSADEAGGRCLAASSFGNRLVLATDWRFYRFERRGARYALSGVSDTGTRTYGVAFTQGGIQYVTASSDGHLRWYDWQSDTPRVSLYVHRNGRSWAVWNSEGQYAASSDMEPDLRAYSPGMDDYVPIDGYRDHFSTDAFANVPQKPAVTIAQQSEKKPFRQSPVRKALAADSRLSIVSPKPGAMLEREDIAIELKVEGFPDAERKHIVLLADGQPVSTTRGIGNLFTAKIVASQKPEPESGRRAFRYRGYIPYGTSELVAKYNFKNTLFYSKPVRIYWADEARPVVDAAVQRIVYLGFGMGDYLEDDLDIRYPNNDVADLLGALQAADTPVTAKTFQDARRAAFDLGFDWLENEVAATDLAVIMIAGHGVTEEQEFLILPTDVQLDRLRATSIGEEYFRARLGDLPSRVLLLLDACHSDEISMTGGIANADRAALQLRDSGKSVVVFASSTGRQLAQENTDWQNGAFTEALIEGITGKGDSFKRGRITLRDLDYYVSRRVAELTNYAQTPIMTVPPGVPDYSVLEL